MKKTLFSATIIVAMVGANFISCKKEELILPAQKNCSATKTASGQNPENSVIVEDGRLSFKTISDFENAASSIAESDDFIARIDALEDFYSTKEKKASYKTTALEDTLIDDEFLAAVLDENYTVQIESYIYKLNFEKRKVFALAVKDKKEHLQDLLSENITNTRIKEFSMEDEVIELIDKEVGAPDFAPIPTAISCSEVGAATNTYTIPPLYRTEVNYNPQTNSQTSIYLRFSPEVAYKSFGIYFRLIAKVKCDLYKENCTVQCWQNYPTDMDIKYTYKYKKKCKTRTDWITATEGTTGPSLTLNVYTGATKLSKYYLEATFKRPSSSSNLGYGLIKDGY